MNTQKHLKTVVDCPNSLTCIRRDDWKGFDKLFHNSIKKERGESWTIHPDSLPFFYSYRSASIGFNLEALFAGKIPKIMPTKAEKIKHLIKYFHTVKPNRLETEVLCGFKIENDDDLKRAGDYFLSLGVKNVFISLDADGIYYKNSKEEGKISTSSVEVKNVTGAGDSFVAGVGYGYMNNLSIKDTVKYAIAMSIVTITHEETINPSMSEDFVNEFIKNMEWIEG